MLSTVNFKYIDNQVSILEEESREAASLLEILYGLRALAKELSQDTAAYDRQIKYLGNLRGQIQQRRQLLEDISFDMRERNSIAHDDLLEALRSLTESQ